MIWLWCTRATWALLPVTTGTALADATAHWSTAPSRLAAVILWAVWAAGLFALFAPRPWGCTLLRIVAPCGLLCVVLSATSTSATSAVLAVVWSVGATALVLSAPVSSAAANALAYGDESRFVLRVPMPLLLGPLPASVSCHPTATCPLAPTATDAVVPKVWFTSIGAEKLDHCPSPVAVALVISIRFVE